MNQPQKERKRILFTTLFIAVIILSNVITISNFALPPNDENESASDEGVLDEINSSSNLNLSNAITGIGDQQNVRVYANNLSQNLNDNQEYFEIPSLASEEMVLTYGNFSFDFQNNYTTDYYVEDDDALYADDFISFDFDSINSNITIHNGSVSGGVFGDLVDGDDSSSYDLSSENGVINFTITANYTDTKYEIDPRRIVKFNRTKILALISSLIFETPINVNLTVRIKDSLQPIWYDVITSLSIKGGSDKQELSRHFINENLKLINQSNICNIQFIFENATESNFIANFYEYDLLATYAFDLPITNKNYVALEFDLRGRKSAVNGLNIWIRTLNLTEAAKTHFNITLYRSNTTIVRTESNLKNINMGPDTTDLIDNIVVNSYTGDNYTYFKFNIVNTGKLNFSNYFLVIKSNNSQQVYSLVTIPPFRYGDNKVEHQLKTTNDNGINWENAEIIIETNDLNYQSGQLDASLFKLNVTRGYMPSDFNMSGMYNLTIQDLPIEDVKMPYSPYNAWGLGQWIHDFATPISDGGLNYFTVYLTWNKTYIKGFQFNVTYSVNAYWTESASSTYSVTYNDNPEWIFNYTRVVADSKFNNWTFLEFWFVYPDYFIAQNLTDPSGQEIYWRLNGQINLTNNPSYDKVVVNSSFGDINGVYSLNLTSYNFIHNMHSYINYNNTLWETNGFMYGDNISIAVEIQDHKHRAPSRGDVNATLFYPDGTRFVGAVLNTSNGVIDDSVLLYDFNNRTILNYTNSITTFGEYHLGFFWFNGSAIGCKEIVLFLDTYEAELYNFDYYSTLNMNILDGKIEKVYPKYTSLIATVNETTGTSRPNYYPIIDSDLNTTLIYEAGTDDVPILIDTYKQNQNIINPNETVNVKVTIQNLYDILPVDAKINVKLISYANEEWIITENTSNSVPLDPAGSPNDTYDFDLNLRIPDINIATKVWAGKNCPIRLAGAKTLITVLIDNIDIGMYEPSHLSLLSNEQSNIYDGYILGLRRNKDMHTQNILNNFSRDDCLYSPDNTSILMNIFDKNYVSSYEQTVKEFSLKLNSKFANISITPNNPIKGQTLKISSLLMTEFGELLAGRNVLCQYYNSSSWVNIGSDTTDSSGSTSFEIDTQQIDFEGNLSLKLSWEGDNVNGISRNISISIIHQSNNILISIEKNSVLIYKNRRTIMTINVKNIGDSNLRIFRNITIEFNHALSYSIVSIDYLKLEHLLSGETTIIEIEIDITNINRLEISVSITAQNIITNETITTDANESFPLNEPSIFDYFLEYFSVIVVALLVLILIGAILYALRTKKKLETPVEVPIKKKPRRERYVPVSELKKPAPPKKPIKKKQEPKEEKEKEEIDLDTLLEERGLTDKKKKK